ncbi:MAG: hypothetical protein QF781_09850 [Phycisphaerales bacterium]|nr:hypothetical protein [Phycisphaerales bacterium]MDP6312441.1 hypothetical protein [Phycisphaerales bacterium]MDP7086550.1 hypothetical protein [Phycisphaerales bacterium]MDP7189084.1 hypothetical protein [Phycisphaerales bacterium]MDP7519801.1 hypothetical protein [Phycisphaerales bacterium]|tara:strand:+ start:780 stop:1247 length:468 start_codon:yes stop_codon:yes gene_type:complete
MSSMPGTSAGFSIPLVRQFSIFLENRVGRLVDILRSFDEAVDVQLHALAVLEATDFAVVRLIPDNADATRQLLRERDLSFSEINIMVIEFDDDHTLSDMCLYLLGAELNIQFMYPIIGDQPVAGPRMAICCDDNQFAGQVLIRKEYRLLGAEDLR